MTIRSAEEFVHLRTSERREDYVRAASEPASVDVWNAIIDKHPDMRFWVAQNKTVPSLVLQRLAGDADSRVREMVARKRSADGLLLARLANDPHVGVRLAVAHNPATPKTVLAGMVADDVSKISKHAARRLGQP